MGMVVTPLELNSKPIQAVPPGMKIIIACFQVDPDQNIENTGEGNHQSRDIDEMIKQVAPETAEGIPKD
jgi:hypothetical protein